MEPVSGAPRVTIGLPFYNSVQTLGDAVRSIFAQTYTDWELILMNDGSLDGSVELVKGITDPRVRLISDGKNCGLPVRLNQIAMLARGEFLARMDADDIMYPGRIETQLQCIQKHPEAVLVAAGATLIDLRGVPFARDRPIRPSRRFDMVRAPQIVHPTVLGRTAWFRENVYSTSFKRAEDLDLWCRTATTSDEIVSIPECLLFYRVGFDLKKYMAALRDQYRITLKYGPDLIAWPATGLLCLYVLARMALWSAAALLGMTDMVLALKVTLLKRFEYLKTREINDACGTMRDILQTEVPGLPQRRSDSAGLPNYETLEPPCEEHRKRQGNPVAEGLPQNK